MYAEKCGGIIDVTKPPYNLDNTGKEDCTKVLCQILDDILRPNLTGIEESWDMLKAIPEKNAKGTLKTKAQGQLITKNDNAVYTQ